MSPSGGGGVVEEKGFKKEWSGAAQQHQQKEPRTEGQCETSTKKAPHTGARPREEETKQQRQKSGGEKVATTTTTTKKEANLHEIEPAGVPARLSMGVLGRVDSLITFGTKFVLAVFEETPCGHRVGFLVDFMCVCVGSCPRDIDSETYPLESTCQRWLKTTFPGNELTAMGTETHETSKFRLLEGSRRKGFCQKKKHTSINLCFASTASY